MKKISILILAAVGLVGQTAGDGPQFTADAQLTLPEDYRQWVFLSSGLGMTYGPAASADPAHPQFDNVFVNPSSYRAFIETGHWPDKTMFVLEVRSATEHGSINNAGGKDKATALPADSSCNNCHGQNAAVENTFVQFYPVLLEIAKSRGTLNAAFLNASAAGPVGK